eukprot:2514052-Pyramimonas_sp.AAC.1
MWLSPERRAHSLRIPTIDVPETSQNWCYGTILGRQDAAVRLIRGVEIPRAMFWHASGSSRRQFPQWE